MSKLIPVQYHNKLYPDNIKPRLFEQAGHFDVSSVDIKRKYSLHTEYSYGLRKFTSPNVQKYTNISKANKNGIPMLWYNKTWAIEFAQYICEYDTSNLQVIEIHPPFSDYSNLESFIENYFEFEVRIKKIIPNVNILIENRSGSMYRGGKFIIRDLKNLFQLSKLIEQANLDLRITLDIPQLFTAHRITEIRIDEMKKLIQALYIIRHNILGLHLWGKKKSKNGRTIAHSGNLDTFFSYNKGAKEIFLYEILCLFNDNVERYFVPEVNSTSKDLNDIVLDLKSVGFHFV